MAMARQTHRDIATHPAQTNYTNLHSLKPSNTLQKRDFSLEKRPDGGRAASTSQRFADRFRERFETGLQRPT
ncbi:hypothetical protein, partial [Bacillus subtilis]|uniref:hypothetical protein n=1 Tax=Bacillus subtilis TaxID=1423 RepID=UPI001BCBCC79